MLDHLADVHQDVARDTPPGAASGGPGARACHISHNSPETHAVPLVVPDDLSSWRPGSGFPTPEMVGSAASLFERVGAWDGTDSGSGSPLAAPWAASAWSPKNPTKEQRPHVGSRSRYLSTWAGSLRFRVTVAPGVVQLSRKDVQKQESAAERAFRSARSTADHHASEKNVPGLAGFAAIEGAGEGFGAVIQEWSGKSRANMVKTLAMLDYAPLFAGDGLPAMVTLTLPGDWETVAPTSAHWTRLIDVFRKRFEKAWGRPLAATWKKEFQRRGAPHLHLFMTVPQRRITVPDPMRAAERDHIVNAYGRRFAPRLGPVIGPPDARSMSFPEWLSSTWAHVVNHPDWNELVKHSRAGTGIDYREGDKASDPQRLAIYFAKHSAAGGGAKEYQHSAPDLWADNGSVGRFWGYWQLEKATASVDLDWSDFIKASRTLRKHSDARRLTREFRRFTPRVDPETGAFVYRRQLDSGAWEHSTDDMSAVPGWSLAGRWRKQRRRSRRRFSGGSGFVTANDGPVLASILSRAVSARGDMLCRGADVRSCNCWEHSSRPGKVVNGG